MVPTVATKCRRFKKIASATRVNMQVAIDLVLLHNQKRTKGMQVQVSLNRAMVLTATSTWERFIADTFYAFNTPSKWFTPGREAASVRGAYSVTAEKRLRDSTACDSYLRNWSATSGTNWAGRKIVAMENLQGGFPGARSGLTLSQHLDQWIELRNGLAHQQIEQLASRAQSHQRWRRHATKLKLKHDDPYHSTSGNRIVLWESKASKATVQAGAARSAVATMVQVLDYAICEIAVHNSWDPEPLRMPIEWFESALPKKYRGLKMEDQDYKTLWGGSSLYRHP